MGFLTKKKKKSTVDITKPNDDLPELEGTLKSPKRRPVASESSTELIQPAELDSTPKTPKISGFEAHPAPPKNSSFTANLPTLKNIGEISSTPDSVATTRACHRIVIGVDYGTTYTGVSYIYSTDAASSTIKDVHDIQNFPGAGRDANAVWKTPSRIAYASENDGCNSNRFGFQVTPKMKSYSWTKLLLDQTARATGYDDPSLKKSEGEGMMKLPPAKCASDVATDFLKELHAWIISYLEKRISPEILAATPMEFWFTVPAIWSDHAKDATRKAALAAGFGSHGEDSIFLIPEPEAAGISTLKSLSDTGARTDAQPDDRLLICDCGGGTVDITCYRVVQVHPKLEFEELVEGMGGKCGSTYIDRAFHRWMSEKFKKQFDDLSFEKRGPGSRFMKDFENHKHDFGYTDNLDHVYEIYLVMPGVSTSEFYDDEESTVQINGHLMLKFFKPVVAKVLALLEQQVRHAQSAGGSKAINRVVLVGGFGDSLYLNKRVREWCQANSITLTCPEHPQSAIARGAALRGLENVAPIHRRSRRYYGFHANEPFRDKIDPEKSLLIDIFDGTRFCATRVLWNIKKGEIITPSTKISIRLRINHFEDDSLEKSFTFYSCSEDSAPDYITDSRAEAFAKMKFTVTLAHLARSETRFCGARRVWNVGFVLEILMGGKEGTLALRVLIEGVELGNGEITYDGSG
ncbi:hypothetical protein B0J11DRAFT_156863 [Dendryphion nanum]|uniref:Actin-like ATPase domain-containing protein n=1 Tax=Dendryphion nanum TaxID=256645 RepID=A0A9P9ED37_9PLEO|nr:hypothetical protein B0J11DRAFT_156863 [Dendryphion nanum]